MNLTIDIPPHLWLTSNRPISNYGMKARIVREIHELVQGLAEQKSWRRHIDSKVIADWTVHYPKGVRTDKGDAANAHPTCKAILDALVPIYLPDDGPRFVVEERYRRGPNLPSTGIHQIWLDLIEVQS